MNIWQEGTMVQGGFDAIVEEIIHSDADVIFFSEVRNYNGMQFVPRIVDALQRKGKYYYGNSQTKLDVGIISKYKQNDQTEIYPDGKGSGSILRVLMQQAYHCCLFRPSQLYQLCLLSATRIRWLHLEETGCSGY